MDVVLVVGKKRWEHRVSGVRGSWGQAVLAFNRGNWGVVDFLNGVGGKALISTVPSPCALKSEFGVVDFVVDVLFKSIIATIHPGDVRVALHVNADGRVEGVGVVDGDTGVVDHDQMAVSTCTGVFSV